MRSERDGVVVRSFFVRGTTPERVLDFYASTFAEEEDVFVIDAPPAAGSDVWRGRWLTGVDILW